MRLCPRPRRITGRPSTHRFRPAFRLFATYRAVSDPGSSAPPRTTVAACKKNRTEIFVRHFSTSQLTVRSGATEEEQPNAPRHPLAKKSDGVGWSSLLSVATYRQVRCGLLPWKKESGASGVRSLCWHARPSPGTEPGKEVMSLERAASDLNGKAWGRPRWSLTAAPQDASLPSGGLCLFYFGKEMKAGGRDVRGELLRERTGFEQVGRGRRKMPCRSEVRGKLLRERTGFEQVGLGRSSTSLPR